MACSFHPEVDREIIAAWYEADARCGEHREAREEMDEGAHEERARSVAGRLFGRWCDLVATR